MLWENALTVSVPAQLGRILSVELQSPDGFIQVVHKVPTLPQKDETPVDMAVFVGNLENPGHIQRKSHIAVALTYKPFGPERMDEFLAEAACYGTDHMSLSSRSMIVIQVCWSKMEQMTVRALGIVPWQQDDAKEGNTNKARHRLTLLYEGQGRDGLRMLVSGLKAYVAEFRKEKENAWVAEWHSPKAAVHYRYDGSGKAHLYKAYDRRQEHRLPSPRRRSPLRPFPHPNVDLVRMFVDKQARLYKPCKHLRILKTKFSKHATDASPGEKPIPAKNLAAILRQLQSLHKHGYAHGDIRMHNLLLDKGCLADFDMARKVGGGADDDVKSEGRLGKRAKKSQTSGERQKQLDLESMTFILCLFQPVDDSQEEDWIEHVLKRRKADLFGLITYLETFPGQVQLREDGESVEALCSRGAFPRKSSLLSGKGKTLIKGLVLNGEHKNKSGRPTVKILTLGEKFISARNLLPPESSFPYRFIMFLGLILVAILAVGMPVTTHTNGIDTCTQILQTPKAASPPRFDLHDFEPNNETFCPRPSTFGMVFGDEQCDYS
uniref:Protein kinase domain-containing protein n=1 Tax=Grammatophora oceanica TaxID=210454 RepID=A0A7S1VSJ1_9STRA